MKVPFYRIGFAAMLTFLAGCQAHTSASSNQATLALVEAGRYDDALASARRTLDLVAKAHSSPHENLATAEENLGLVLLRQARPEEAEQAYRRAVAIRKQTAGPKAPATALSLADLSSALEHQHRFIEASELLTQAISILEAADTDQKGHLALMLMQSGDLSLQQGALPSALDQLQRADDLVSTLPDAQADLLKAQIWNKLATAYRMQGFPEKAHDQLTRALTHEHAHLSPDHPNIALLQSNLAELEISRGNPLLALELQSKALPSLERSYGKDHPVVASLLANMATAYREAGALSNAIDLAYRALQIHESKLGPKNPDTAASYALVAALNYSAGHYHTAETLSRKSLTAFQESYSPTHPKVADALINLGEATRQLGKGQETESLYAQALTILTQHFGHTHPRIAQLLNNRAALYRELDKPDLAASDYQRASDILEQLYGLDHPLLAPIYIGQARLAVQAGKLSDALAAYRQATDIHQTLLQSAVGGKLGDELTRAKRLKSLFLEHVATLEQLTQDNDGTRRQHLIDESFQIAQLARASDTAKSLNQMSARLTIGSRDLSHRISKRQSLVDVLRKLNDRLVTKVSSSKRRADDLETIEQLRFHIHQAQAELGKLDDEISNDFPTYADMAAPSPVSIDEIRSYLRDQDAIIMFASDEAQLFVWVVTIDEAHLHRVDVGEVLLAERINKFRRYLDPKEAENRDGNGLNRTFNAAFAHGLYRALFGPADAILAGAKTLYVVADGPLQTLPLQTLITRPTDPAILTLADFAHAPWLVREHAITYLPSVSSLPALRKTQSVAKAPKPFLGIGDPILRDHPTQLTAITTPSKRRNWRSTLEVATLLRDQQFDPALIKLAPSLPETAEELRSMARILGAESDSLYLQAQAAEHVVKSQISFNQYRTITFATHGIVAGELPGISEPGLILTPPATATAEDNGLLTASEIAGLELNSDWVILSACNTASDDGTIGAEGFSGLTKAFFHAGSRALFVSHWAVLSEPTVTLTTAMLQRLEADPAIGRAAAHQQAILQMLTHPEKPWYVHPTVWAPFVVVGDAL